MANNLDEHYVVKFAKLLLKYDKEKKVNILSGVDKMLMDHILRKKITDYGTVKLINNTLLKYQDEFKSVGIEFKSLESSDEEHTKSTKKIFDTIKATIDLNSNILELRLPWIPRHKFDKLIQFLKENLDMQFENRKDSDPVWYVKIQDENIFDEFKKNELVCEIGYDISEIDIKKSLDKLELDRTNQKKLFRLSTTANLTETDEFKGMFAKLYPFQQVAVEYSKHRNGILIADEMGLGKTVQALAIMEYHQLYPAVIIVPAMLRKNWKKEIDKWLPNKQVSVIESTKIVPPGDIYVVSYSMVSRLGARFFIRKPKLLICDESHYLKNPNAARTDYILKYFKDVEFKILTTGTPILNKTIELLPQLDLIGVLDTHFGGQRKYKKRYAPPVWNGYGTVYQSANEEELQVELRKSCMIRRMKRDVLNELPDKIKQVVTLPLHDRTAYRKVERDSINWYETKLKKQKLSQSEITEKVNEKLQNRSDFAEKMVKVEYLRQAAVEYKMEATIQWIEGALEQVDKLIVFAHHRDVIEQLYEKFSDISVMLYGGMSNKSGETVDKFINDKKIKLFIGSLQASGVGIDGLQNVCNHVAFVEMAWTPAMMSQAEDRAHRIGQTDTVNIYYLLGENTIEEYVFSVVVEKQELFDKATNINKLFTWMKNKKD